MRAIGTLLFGMMSTSSLAQPVVTPPVFIPLPASPSSRTLFTLPTGHTLKFMSITGNDANPGTKAQPWKTPNHAMSCGDVLVSLNGDYSSLNGLETFGATSNCPSTSGGIDGTGPTSTSGGGTGGVNYAIMVCGGSGSTFSDMGANGCIMNCATACSQGGGPRGSVNTGIDVKQNNWAVEGWQVGVAASGGGQTLGYLVDPSLTPAAIAHHVAFINDIATNLAVGYGTECYDGTTAPPGTCWDYFSVIASLAWNAAIGFGGTEPFAFCAAGITMTTPSNLDTNAGTHNLFYGDFSFNNGGGATKTCQSDQEGFMLDTFDEHGYTQQSVIMNNMYWFNGRFGIQVFNQNHNNTIGVPGAVDFVLNNTGFANGALQIAQSSGDVNYQGACGGGDPACQTPHQNWNDVLTIQNNIVKSHWTSGGGAGLGGTLYPQQFGGQSDSANTNSITSGGTGTQNVYKGMATTCAGASCNTGSPTKDATEFNGLPIGTNTYTDPLFANETDLLNNWVTSKPNCTGFTNVTKCMGYDPNTSTLTSNTPIADLQPSCTGCSGKGYQLPSTTCASSGPVVTYFPSHLKGIVYLQYDPTDGNIYQYHDGVTTPCGL